MPSTEERLKAVKILIDIFKMERILHVSLTILSVIIILIIAIYQFYASANTTPFNERILIALSYFGPAGLFSITVGRLMYMFNQALKFINQENIGNGK